MDIFQATEKVEQVSTVLNMCVMYGKIDGCISRRNPIAIPFTARDLIPQIASKTSLSVTLDFP
jgi:hypothetical protein